jgi:hypothetical protein
MSAGRRATRPTTTWWCGSWGRGWRAWAGALGIALAACRPVLAPPPGEAPADAPARWGARLAEIVRADGLVDYDALEADRAALDDYVRWIATPRPGLSGYEVRHAFWLNAYNALVLYAVLEDGRPASVLDVPGWLPRPGSGFFLERAFVVDGRPTSLWEIEHERLRGRIMDLRDHAALNCASRSCPPLRPELYEGARLGRQLDAQMRAWLGDAERGVRVEDGALVFNPIVDWYAWDFHHFTSGKSVCATASRFVEGELRQALVRAEAEGCPYTTFDYDWSLNDASGRARPGGSGGPG